MGDQLKIPFSIYRGGTSKAVFFLAEDIPPSGAMRDRFLLRILGKPDPDEIDGIGGGHLRTSKVGILSPSQRPGINIDYTFGQIALDRDIVDYRSNCGNISAAVAAFAIDRGYANVESDRAHVAVYNTNTDKTLYMQVPLADGEAAAIGDFAIAGIPGTGARIDLDFRHTIGANTGKLLPTGNTIDEIPLSDGSIVRVSITDAAIAVGHVLARDMGIKGDETPAQLRSNTALIQRFQELRAKVAQKSGIVQTGNEVASNLLIPFISIISPPRDYRDTHGNLILGENVDFLARLMAVNSCHPAYAGTGACSTAACSAIAGTLVNQLLQGQNKSEIRIGHPLGAMPVQVERGRGDAFQKLAYARTARRLIEGYTYIPKNYF
ncbi:MAG: PrpF domain-containing protein [Cyanobacteria bacterium P01_E01_bin.42]